MKIEEDEQNDFPEDIPFPEYFQRVTVEQLKERFNEYLEVNIEEQYLKNPEFYLSDDVNEKRFYLQIKEFPEKYDKTVKMTKEDAEERVRKALKNLDGDDDNRR